MVHASLRKIGRVEGGAATVIDALDEAVGLDGTLLMTLGARDDDEPFDCAVAPADPDVGVLAEVFRTYPGTLVSDHPEGRFGARGKHADALTRDVPWDDYYGPGSPLERFVDLDGKVLRLGANPDTVTLLHWAEYLAPVPDKRRVRRRRLVQTPTGPQVRVVECLDDRDGIVEHPGEDYFATILTAYVASGRAAVGTVGHARCELLDGHDLVDFAVAWMAEHLAG